MLAAVIMGLCGGSVIDVLAPIYTACVGALIVAKYLAEQKSGGRGKEAVEEEELEDVSSSSASSSAGGPGNKPLLALREPTTGLTIPASLAFVGGGDGPLVSVGCGARVKELGFLKVKVYALGVFAEQSGVSRAALEPVAKAGGADLFKVLLSQEPATFFRRALHLVFARRVSGKQVADALAEKLKANLSPDAFSAFSQALLAGIGPKGLAEGDALTFVWAAPSALRLFVRGSPCSGASDLVDDALPRVLHAGLALGPDPAVPDAKAATAKNIGRVFYLAGGSGGGGGAASGGGARRAGSKVVAARTVTEPATGLALPTELSLDGGGSTEADGSPVLAAVRLQLLGCGVKVKTLGFLDVQVYAVGLYAEPAGCKAALTPWHKQLKLGSTGGAPPAGTGIGPDEALFEALLAGGPGGGDDGAAEPVTFYPRALHLVFARRVSGQQVADALAERLQLHVSAAAFSAFSRCVLAGVGPDTPLAKGDALSYLWSAPRAVRVFVRGQCVGAVADDTLPRTLFAGFLGPHDPQSPAAKAAVPAGAAALF